jgi:hypothetical protein
MERPARAQRIPQSDVKSDADLSDLANVKTENPFEKELVRLLYSGNHEILEEILEKISVDSFANPKYKALAEVVVHGYNDNRISPAYLIEQIENEELRSFILKHTMIDLSISKNWDEFSYDGEIKKDTIEYARDTVRAFLIYQIDKEIETNNKIIAESKDERLHLELMRINKERLEEKKALIENKNRVRRE